MTAIPDNPHIVGNPIKTRDMFFGREDDVQYVERKIGAADHRAPQGPRSVLCGASHEISDSPFVNIFAVVHLGRLRRAEALELIRTPSQTCGRPLEAASGRILAMGGLYPFFLQIASSACFEYVLETLPEEEHEALRAVLEGRPPEATPAETLERKGYLCAPSENTSEPFSEEFGRFAVHFLNAAPRGGRSQWAGGYGPGAWGWAR